MQTRHADAAFCQVLALERVLRYDDRAIAFTKTSAAIKQHIFIADMGIRSKAKCSYVVDFLRSRLIERFNVGQDVGKLQARRAHLLRGQPVKHEGVVGVRRMS